MLSHVVGPTDIPLLSGTIGEALDHAARRWPERLALIDRGQGERLTWAALRERATAVAVGLLELGLKPGDRIGIWSLNRVEWTLIQFAAAKAGLILVTINPAYRIAELQYALQRSACAALVVSPPFKSSNYPAMVQALAPELADATDGFLQSPALPALRRVIRMDQARLPGAMSFSDLEGLGRSASSDALHAIEAGDASGFDAVGSSASSGDASAFEAVGSKALSGAASGLDVVGSNASSGFVSAFDEDGGRDVSEDGSVCLSFVMKRSGRNVNANLIVAAARTTLGMSLVL